MPASAFRAAPLSLKTLDDPLRDDPIAAIDESCVGCGNCGEVADAAILCPSFYKAEIVSNDKGPARWWAERSRRIIARLQKKRAAGRLEFQETGQ